MEPRKYALLTGATTKKGIGYAIALQLLAQGYGIILVGRKTETLQDIAESLEHNDKKKVFFITQDLAASDAVAFIIKEVDELVRKENIRIDVLINNAGFVLEGDFLKNTQRDIRAMILVHVMNLALLTWHFAGRMRTQNFGRIMNTSSVMGFTPVPFNALYAATKAFAIILSYSLSWEMKHVHKTDVRVIAICPGATETEFWKRAKYQNAFLFTNLRFMIMESDDFAKKAVEMMFKGKRIYIPGVYNRILVFIARYFPRPVPAYLAAFLMKNRG